MAERPLFPNGPVANRDQSFLDRAGNNAFRELDEPVEAIPVDASPGDAANAAPSGTAGYASPHTPGVRRWQSGDFVPTRTGQANGIIGYSIMVFVATALGWLSYWLVWVGFVEIAWQLFVCAWFFGFLIVAASACWTANQERFLARIGVIAAEEQGPIALALRYACGACLVSGLSFTWVLYQLLV